MDSGDSNKDLNLEMFSILLDPSPIAYVRPVSTDKGINYGVYSSDGTQLALFTTQEAAFFTAKQHDLEPVLIH